MNPTQLDYSMYKRFAGWLKEELNPNILFRSLTTGLLIYILEIIVVISFSALIFSGGLADQLPFAIGFIILGDAILVGSVALLSSFRGMIAVEQDAPGAILAITSAAMMAAMPANATSSQRLATVIFAISGTSLLAGLFFISLGIFKLGGLVRFLPYPVIGGFLAGTGWLLVTGGIISIVEAPLSLAWLQPDFLLRWLPGMLLGVIILLASNHFKNPLLIPVLVAGAVGLFYAAAWLTHIPLTLLQSEGWLLSTFPTGGLGRFPLIGSSMADVDWHMLWQNLPTLLALPLISVVALLLNTNGIELIAKKEINLTHELITTGIGNILSGLAGGITGYPAISLTALNHKTSSDKRLPGIIAAVLIGLTAFAGVTILSYIPKMVLGGLLVYLGLGMLVEWVYLAWFKFPRIDFFIIILILGIVAIRGFLEAVAVGLVVTIILFVINYSRIRVVKHTLNGKSYHSRVTRNHLQQNFLNMQGNQLYILKLQGFIFFGTANNLFEQIRDRASQSNQPKIRFILLDFSQVSGLDSTGLLSFNKLLDFTQDQQITLVLTGLRGRCLDQFTHSGFTEKPGSLHFFPDIDRGTEWCEEQILAGAPFGTLQEKGLHEQLQAILNDPQQIRKLLGYMQRQEIAQGQYLINQGDDPEFIFLIESGQLTAQLEALGKTPMRLETMRGGRTVGELGFYLGSKRSAAVIADEPSVVYALSQAEMSNIEQHDPESASVFHRIIVHLMGERILHLIQAVDALQD